MTVIETTEVTHRYGRVTALDGVSLEVPEGSVYGLIGPNGSGKTTLLEIVTGLRRPTAWRATVLGRDAGSLKYRDRMEIGYIAEGQRLPHQMTLRQLEAYLAPLYDGWDFGLADSLRGRFRLDPGRRVDKLSRGDAMKAALLCALAPRPKLLVMDEPFTGMDVRVRDELVRGLLDSAGRAGWSVLICSHDIAELEPLIDRVGFLDGGRLVLQSSMEDVRARFRWVDVTLRAGARLPAFLPRDWLSAERSGHRLRFLTSLGDAGDPAASVAAELDGVVRVDVSDASLRDVFLGLSNESIHLARASSAAPEAELPPVSEWS